MEKKNSTKASKKTEKTNKQKKQEYISCSGIKYRGWTDSMIKKFLPAVPDKEEVNPHYAFAAPMKLYKLKRIEKIEKTPEFINAMEKSKSRKAGAAKAVQTKRQKAISWAETVEIDIPDMEKKDLTKRAIRNYEWYHGTLVLSYDDAFLVRICTNYLRHQCTDYDYWLDSKYGTVGVQTAHDILQTRINDAIREKYDWLRPS